MKLSHCHFKTTFYRFPLLNRGIYLKVIHVRRKAIFIFLRTCIACVNTITFQIGYIQESEPPHKNNRNYCAIFVCFVCFDYGLTSR